MCVNIGGDTELRVTRRHHELPYGPKFALVPRDIGVLYQGLFVAYWWGPRPKSCPSALQRLRLHAPPEEVAVEAGHDDLLAHVEGGGVEVVGRVRHFRRRALHWGGKDGGVLRIPTSHTGAPVLPPTQPTPTPTYLSHNHSRSPTHSTTPTYLSHNHSVFPPTTQPTHSTHAHLPLTQPLPSFPPPTHSTHATYLSHNHSRLPPPTHSTHAHLPLTQPLPSSHPPLNPRPPTSHTTTPSSPPTPLNHPLNPRPPTSHTTTPVFPHPPLNPRPPTSHTTTPVFPTHPLNPRPYLSHNHIPSSPPTQPTHSTHPTPTYLSHNHSRLPHPPTQPNPRPPTSHETTPVFPTHSTTPTYLSQPLPYSPHHPLNTTQPNPRPPTSHTGAPVLPPTLRARDGLHCDVIPDIRDIVTRQTSRIDDRTGHPDGSEPVGLGVGDCRFA
ncbi:hypothetical protein C7M84_014101 [Penaeus vannamei]|uniref:Uncharacterized protein n=1 Tax=Penaeus vannamei TaxID=6689 RepID=A0A3R7LZW3_PENVA|nr:hypothetical protein C7M84_014101 [Penaeus vannamei]